MVGPTTTREVLYVSATRGKEANRLYVDTHYDPDPQTSHDDALGPITAKGVLLAVLRNEGAEIAAHEAIRRAQHEAEGIGRLSAEYLTLATEAQAERWDALLARSGLSEDELAAVAASAARGPLFAGLRDAEARGLDVEAALAQLVAGKSLADAADVASVLHSRVDRWSHAAGGRRRHTGHLIAGLIPRAQGVTDPDMARALAERDQTMEQGALSLAEEAIAAGQRWVRLLGAPGAANRPNRNAGCEKCQPSRPTGTTGTSRANALSVRLRVEKTWNKRPNASGRWPSGSGPRRSVPARWISGSILAWSRWLKLRRGSNCEGNGSGANRRLTRPLRHEWGRVRGSASSGGPAGSVVQLHR